MIPATCYASVAAFGYLLSNYPQLGKAKQQHLLASFLKQNRGFALGAVDIYRFNRAKTKLGVLHALSGYKFCRAGGREIVRRRMRDQRLRGVSNYLRGANLSRFHLSAFEREMVDRCRAGL